MGGKECQFASVRFPILWLAYTLVRGALVEDRTGRNFYPYPYPYPLLDVVEHGYARIAVNIVLVAALSFVLALGALAADKRLRGVHAG